MIEKKHILMAALLFAIYVVTGVIVFPEWYFGTLQYGGIHELLYAAETRYVIWNIIALILISLIVFIIDLIEKNNPGLHNSISNFLKGKTSLTFLWVFILLAAFRLISVSFHDKTKDINQLAEKIEDLEIRSRSDSLVSLPIEIIYFDKDKIDDLYSQLSPSLQLSERSLGKRQNGTLDGTVGVEGVASVNGKIEDGKESQEKYTSRNISISEKAISIINKLNSEKNLLKIIPVIVESKELTSLNIAADAFNANQIKYDMEKLEKTKKIIINNALQSKAQEIYKTNSWVLISGPVGVASANENYLNFKFEYFSGAESYVSFSCDLPTSKFNKSEFALLQSQPKWELNIFGKIINSSNGKSNKYSLSCFAVYR